MMFKRLKTKLLSQLASFFVWLLAYGEKPKSVQIWEHGVSVDKQIIGTLGILLKVRNENGEEFIAPQQAVSVKLYWDAWHAWRDEDVSITWEDGTELTRKDFYA